MKYFCFVNYLFFSIFLTAQQKVVKKSELISSVLEIKTDGVDHLIIQENESNLLELTIFNADGLRITQNIHCDDDRCVLNIQVNSNIDHPLNNKINQFSIAPPNNVTIIIKIPKNKTVRLFSDMIDVQTNGYAGNLYILIDRGNIRITELKGITEISLFAGTVVASVNKQSIDIHSTKGHILMNTQIQKSPYRKNANKKDKLYVKSIHANVILTGQ